MQTPHHHEQDSSSKPGSLLSWTSEEVLAVGLNHRYRLLSGLVAHVSYRMINDSFKASGTRKINNPGTQVKSLAF